MPAADDTDDEGLEASIDEMIELPEGGVPYQLAIAMHPTPTSAAYGAAAGAAGGLSSPEESLVCELLQGCERLETEKDQLKRRMNEMLVDHDSMERRVFEVELEKRGLTTLLEQESSEKESLEAVVKTRENQWRGLGTESLSDSELSELLEQLESSVSKVRKAQDVRRERRHEALARDLMCPITGEIVKDPGVATDGHTYERAAIERCTYTRYPFLESSEFAGQLLTYCL